MSFCNSSRACHIAWLTPFAVVLAACQKFCISFGALLAAVAVAAIFAYFYLFFFFFFFCLEWDKLYCPWGLLKQLLVLYYQLNSQTSFHVERFCILLKAGRLLCVLIFVLLFCKHFCSQGITVQFLCRFWRLFCEVASFLEAICFLIRISSCSSGCWDFVFQVSWLLVERRKNLVWSLILEWLVKIMHAELLLLSSSGTASCFDYLSLWSLTE